MMITIKEKEYKLKYTIRALFIYEQIRGKSFKFDGLYEEYILFFCVLLANNPEFDMTFDEFITLCDDEPKLFQTFREWFLREIEKQALFKEDAEETEEDDTKKKN